MVATPLANVQQPTLWVADILVGLNIPGIWNIRTFHEAKEIPPGSNYILDDPSVPEYVIRAIGWQAPENCWVHRISSPVENLIGEAVSAKELSIQILDCALPFPDWAKRQDSDSLSLKEAMNIARVAFKRLSGSELKAELGTLRIRCNQSSYDWNKLMTSLEEEFNQELERRGIMTNSSDPSARLKLEIKRYIAEKDEAKKALIAKDLRKQGISNQEIKAIANQLDTSFRTSKPKVFTSWDLLNYESDVTPWLIAGLLPSTGVSIVAGTAGTGKSTLAYDCAFSVVSGEPFLGEAPARTGKVLFLTGDEPFDQAYEKFITRGFFGYMGTFEIVHNWDISQMELLEEKLEELRPALVVIDSFSSIHQNEVFDENSSAAAKSLYKLNHLCECYNAAGLMIHHANKNKEQKGVNQLRGSSAIAAAACAVWIMSGDGDVKKLTTPKLRGGADKLNLDISLDKPSGRFYIVSGNEEIEQSKPVMRRVRELFESLGHDQRLKLEEIKHHVGGTSDSVYKALNRLCGQGVIVKALSKSDSRKKVYYLSSKYVIPTPSPSPNPLILSKVIAESNTPQGLDILDKTLDKTLDILDNSSENHTNLGGCLISESNTPQGFEEKHRTEKRREQGGGVLQCQNQVTQNTGTENITTGEAPTAPSSIPISDLKVGDIIESPNLPLGMEGWGRVTSISEDAVYVELCKYPILLSSITLIRRT